MRTDWDGHYLDGRTAARRPAKVRILRTGLELTLADAPAPRFWPFAAVRQTQGFYAGEPVRLEHGGPHPEALLVADAGFLAALRAIAPEATRRFHDPRRRRLRLQLTVLAGLLTVVLAVALHAWGIPTLATAAAARVPVRWEAALGDAVAQRLAPAERRCGTAGEQAVIDAIVARLLRGVGQPYTFRVTVVDDRGVNAFAAPGGSIVVLRGLLERTETPEELAGVLAHEIQHVLHRDSTKAIFRHASSGILMAALVGDVTGIAAFGLEGARALSDLRHSRAAEEEADADGLRMLRAARVDAAGMLAFFDKLAARHGAGDPGLARYLSTHPSPRERLDRPAALAAQPGPPTEPLLPGLDWPEFRALCAGPRPGSPPR